MKLSITLVTYNHTYNAIKPTIDSVLHSTLDFKLYIIDNSPSPQLEDELPKDSRIEYLFRNANNGFGAGHNVIMKNPKFMGTYHLILNPDVEFNEGTLEALCEYMDNNPDVGNVMPKVIYPDGELQYLCKLLPSPMDWIGRKFIPFNSIKKRINDTFEMRFADYNEEMNVPYLSGCFMFLRSSAIKEIGLFDENIFMYGEDTDLNRRIYQKYRTMYYPSVTIIHAHERGSYKNRKLLKIHMKAAIYYMNKWGWIFDKERREINKKTKSLYGKNS